MGNLITKLQEKKIIAHLYGSLQLEVYQSCTHNPSSVVCMAYARMLTAVQQRGQAQHKFWGLQENDTTPLMTMMNAMPQIP